MGSVNITSKIRQMIRRREKRKGGRGPGKEGPVQSRKQGFS